MRLDAVWAELAAYADSDRDGRLSYQESHHGMTRAFIEGLAFVPVFRPAAEAVVQLCDTDGDGRVVRAELRRSAASLQHPASGIPAAFNRIDTDGDGWLSTAELVAAIRAY